MIEIKVKNDEIKMSMQGSAEEIFFEWYGALERFTTVLKEAGLSVECYSELCELLRAGASGKTMEEYVTKLLKKFS